MLKPVSQIFKIRFRRTEQQKEVSYFIHQIEFLSCLAYKVHDQKQLNVKDTDVPKPLPGLYLLWP